jgi:hypothetical protein
VETPAELLSILALATGESVRSATQFIHQTHHRKELMEKHINACQKEAPRHQEQESLAKRGEKCLRSSSPVKTSIRTLFPSRLHFQGDFLD